AWAGGVAYALSGWFLSQMSYYNLVAGAALAPAFAAACVAGAAAAAGTLWALLLLAGDPTMAALAALLAIVALALGRERGAARAPWRLLVAVALGTLVAAPQLGELLRALPTSTRAVRGFDVAARTLGSWD